MVALVFAVATPQRHASLPLAAGRIVDSAPRERASAAGLATVRRLHPGRTMRSRTPWCAMRSTYGSSANGGMDRIGNGDTARAVPRRSATPPGGT